MLLVTGASGRIGRALVERLAKKGERIRALVRNKESANVLPKGVEVAIGDITDKGSLEKAVKGIDRVIHLAGSVDFDNQDKMMGINAEGTRNLLEACPKSLKRFVHCSSITVYGKNPGKDEVDETAPLNPDSVYAKSKFMAEKYCLENCKKFPITILRLGILYGPGFEAGYSEVFGKLKEGKMRIIGKGDNVIPFVHVDDAVEGIIKALDVNVPSCSVYNIVGEKKTQIELMEMAAKAMGVEPPKKGVSLFLARIFMGTTPARMEYLNILSSNRDFSSKKAEKELKWKAKIGLEEGITGVVAGLGK